ncbi:Ankyrin repeat-containing domain protein [Cordyceps fumosorosea ARSEF 2679]|uniref:Ankyrin repeat-containing domain protein n=1 Tax=Cordyceps fumosorosea (strain ARSEF 2679) TaxID=1081104 RepID=A0A162I9C2_CORFA|nr:Ankyrin repeat-containing domain protein [Cordyceps fumosorosea ARSEF 2679]OAA54015.1 Ankyrin repeat-containing domain protein [Cordyceps fumosorosea ARSEF 2679]
MARLSDLPTEVLELIINELYNLNPRKAKKSDKFPGYPDLSRLARTNQKLQHLIQPIIFCEQCSDDDLWPVYGEYGRWNDIKPKRALSLPTKALFYASMNGQEAGVKKALQYCKKGLGCALWVASQYLWTRREKIVRLLLAEYYVDKSGKKPLLCALGRAARSGSISLIDAVLERVEAQGLDLKELGTYNYFLLQEAAEGLRGNLEHLLKLEKIDINAKDDMGRTLFAAAWQSGKDDLVQSLISTGKVNVDERDEWGRTPLHLLIHHGSWSTAEILIRTDKSHSWEGVKLLLDTGKIDVNDLGGEHCSKREAPLHRAAKEGHRQSVKLLLGAEGIEVNLGDGGENTALHVAARANRPDVVELLLADPRVHVDASNKREKTALHLAVDAKCKEVVMLLLMDSRVSVNAREEYGLTALHLAVEAECQEVLTILLADPRVQADAGDSCGETPLQRARRQKCPSPIINKLRYAEKKKLCGAGANGSDSEANMGQAKRLRSPDVMIQKPSDAEANGGRRKRQRRSASGKG